MIVAIKPGIAAHVIGLFDGVDTKLNAGTETPDLLVAFIFKGLNVFFGLSDVIVSFFDRLKDL